MCFSTKGNKYRANNKNKEWAQSYLYAVSEPGVASSSGWKKEAMIIFELNLFLLIRCYYCKNYWTENIIKI